MDWLVRAFDFEVIMAIEGPEDAPHMCHYEMAIEGRGRIMIGGESYRAVDPEGHVWTFSRHVRDVTRAEAEAAIGVKIEAASWT